MAGGVALFDYDGDGLLDVFFTNGATQPGLLKDSPAWWNRLYRNRGQGVFEDVTARAGVRGEGFSMGAAVADYDNDGHADLFVAGVGRNILYRNRGDGSFEDVTTKAGIHSEPWSVSAGWFDDGRALSSMGVDFRDVDNDERPDLFITALAHETYPFYRNLGKGLFGDATYRTRIGAATVATTGWSAGIYDFNNDGRKDLFAANGDLNEARNPNIALAQRAGGAFDAFAIGPPALHRGAAFGDFDNDGRVDAVVARMGEKPLLLRNTSVRQNHWLGLRLVGRRGNRDAIGAQAHLRTASGEQWNQVTTAVGYASSSDVRVHFGLGGETKATLEIRWPGGATQRVGTVQADRYLTV